MPARHNLSRASIRMLHAEVAALASAAIDEVERRHRWYASLSGQDRASVGVVAQAGVRNFLAWLEQDTEPDVPAVFAQAPRELTRSVSLAQTLELVRSVVDTVEVTGGRLIGESQAPRLRDAILRYSREVAFAAAHVYATTAEQRGAWEARLEGLVVDAVLRGESDDGIQSRAAALGWGATTRVAVVAATPANPLPHSPIEPARILGRIHDAATREGMQVLAAVQAGRVILILGDTADPMGDTRRLQEEFGDGPIVVGPTVPHLFAAGRSARAAIAGHAAAHAWPQAPRPAHADELLAERSLLGDVPARNALVTRVARRLAASPGSALLVTAEAYLHHGGNLEAAARALYVHPNTVRYRLGRIAETISYDLTDPHEAFVVRLAIGYGRLADAGISGTGSIPRR